ncbi:MAG TPA: VOC family protein [Acidimicrobiales bacterium]|nr:VOC family protein [Acidimicrobiales bacterium]
MPVPESIPAGNPIWIDLYTSDPDASRAFYGELFGWTSEQAGEEYGGYINFSKDGHLVAGGMANDGQSGAPDMWTIYLAVDDAQAVADATRAQGGQVVVEPMPVGTLGTMVVLTDPSGAGVGAWQPGDMTGFQLLAEDGAPAWFELHTREHGAAVSYYEKVFGWDTHAAGDTDEFRYTTLGEGEAQAAGIMDASAFLPEGVPAHWSVYFGVADTDATIAKAVELGASVVQPAEDTPYGRLAVLTDPTGAVFKLVSVDE